MKREPEKPQSAINVTPLVDVCLVLLIIFMVVTPLLGPSAAVNLPEGRDPRTLPDDRRHPVLALRKDGTLWYGQSWLPEPEMLERLKEARERDAAVPLVLYADAELSFADVRRTMRIVEKAGFRGVSLAVRKPAAAP